MFALCTTVSALAALLGALIHGVFRLITIGSRFALTPAPTARQFAAHLSLSTGARVNLQIWIPIMIVLGIVGFSLLYGFIAVCDWV
jgi:hypothetical protein